MHTRFSALFGESLEPRRLLAASLDGAGVLSITADENPNDLNDTIILQRVLNNSQYRVMVSISNSAGTSVSYFLWDSVNSVNADLGDGNNRLEWVGQFGKPGTLRGGTGNDTIIGGVSDEYLIGDVGHDSLVGGAGNDTMDASAGNDTLQGAAGADLFLGGNNLDTADFSDQHNTIYVTLDDVANDGLWSGAQPPSSSEGDNVAVSVERIRGTDAFTTRGDYIVGSGKDNIIWGGDNDDTLIGFGGNDTIYGGSGDDYLDGGSGDDSLLGEFGSDLLLGSGGDDVLIAAGDLLLNFDTLSGGSGSNDTGTWDLLVDTVTDAIPG